MVCSSCSVRARAAAEAAAGAVDGEGEGAAGFEGCALKATAKNLVFADGTPDIVAGPGPGLPRTLGRHAAGG